jgi:CubicO group peptidase (beta-lactamase class C family)
LSQADYERWLRTLQAERRLPSVSAAVFVRGEPVWQLAVGLADVESGREATPDTQYRVASITKTFTAAAVMQLRDAGAVDLGAPAAEYVPELADRRMTVKDLLSHASGLQREEPGAEWEPIAFLSHAELFARMGEAERVLEPRDEFHYSNLGYMLLGEIVARTSGQAYTTYVEERLFAPVGLDATTWDPLPTAAVGYHMEPWTDAVHVEAVPDLGEGRASGQLWSTTPDLARWAGFLRDPDPDVLRPETAAEMCRLQTIADHSSWKRGWGLGICLWRDGDRLFAGHSGGMNGFLSNVAFELRGWTGAVLLTNASTSLPVEALGVELAAKAAASLAPPPEPWRPGEAPPPELEGVLGNWWTEGWEFIVSYRGGKLQAAAVGSAADPAVFERVEGDRYVGVSGRERGEPLEIVRDEDGRPVKLLWATYPMTRTSLPMT